MATIIGIDSFIEDLGIAAKAAKPVVEKAALAMALEVRRLAQAKVAKRTTALAQSITSEAIPYGAMTTVNEKYGIYLEEGTGMFDPRGPHLIYSNSGGPLAWKAGGQQHFAMYTRGMESQPFFWPSVKDSEPFILEQMGNSATALIAMAVGK